MKIVEIKSVKKIQNDSKRYDIKTKTDNFFANGILVHNCSSLFFTYQKRVWGLKKRGFGVCSRNIWLRIKSKSHYWHIAKKYDLEKKLLKIPHNVAINGEINGEGIQKNKYKIEGLDLFVFNVYIDDRMLGPDEMQKFCADLGLKTVPILRKDFVPSKEIPPTLTTVSEIVQYLTNMSEGNSVLLPRKREGIVVRLVDNPRVSFKVINPQFLLEGGE